ncbi:oligogalacturonate lyase family protein [Echinicola jeungdonensis]|uniref:Oligogalacturonate lyase family protein n=1 Tax=Echinicola jeungdonensis TaxID=709343 RepID=A0ABV5JAY7_9BACT|nr:oligogalacturonate lyase family protein [Echinicola jeungdonensis]MDN3669477.1 oligogalacturonate lyase family protein [Echinicola jeungdonensis]
MKKIFLLIAVSLAVACEKEKEEIPKMETGGNPPMPEAWIDKDTGHKVVRLSNREGINRSFYFHNNPFFQSEDGTTKMVFYGSVGENNQLFTIDMETKEITQLTDDPEGMSGEIVGKKTGRVYYQRGDSVFATDVNSGRRDLVYVFPEGFNARISTINADEKLLAGAKSVPAKDSIYRANPEKSQYFNKIYDAKLPHALFTVNLETQELDTIHSDTAWINHIQFSPVDPDQLMFCHEGPWHKVDRIWNINVKTGEVQKMHERTMDMEIAGHEFWSRDGEVIWYDLQMPRGETFYLAGVNVKNGERYRYQMDRNDWSIHFNISPDQNLFAGDGGDPGQVAKAEDGQWIYLFTPKEDRLESEKLVNMAHHDYSLEPNVHFSPDGNWVIFRANFEGESQIYAVEVEKEK